MPRPSLCERPLRAPGRGVACPDRGSRLSAGRRRLRGMGRVCRQAGGCGGPFRPAGAEPERAGHPRARMGRAAHHPRAARRPCAATTPREARAYRADHPAAPRRATRPSPRPRRSADRSSSSARGRAIRPPPQACATARASRPSPLPDIRWGRCDIKSVSPAAQCAGPPGRQGRRGAYEAWLVDSPRPGHRGRGLSNAWIVDARTASSIPANARA